MIPLGREHPIPFTKGSKNPLAGRDFMEGPGGGFESLFQREAKIPWRGGILWRGQGEPSVMVPPRPLQATPTPSSGFGVDVCSASGYRSLPCRARQDKG